MAEGRLAVLTDAGGVAGAEQVLIDVARAWGAAGTAEVHAVLPEGARQLAEQLRAAGAATSPVRHLDRALRPGPLRDVRAALRAADPDAVVVNLTDQGDGRTLLPAARWWGGPVTALLHLWIPGARPWRTAIHRATLGCAGAVVTPGAGTAAALRAHGTTAEVVPNGVAVPDPLPRAAARAALGLPADLVVVGGLGRLEDQKGWDLLAAAWADVLRAAPGAVAAVIGEGPARPRLEGGALHLLGARPGAARLLTAFDLVVVPSRFEAHALVPMEAACCGVPTVLADVPGVRESAGPGSVLHRPDDPAALAAALVGALGDLPALRAAAQGGAGRYAAEHSVDAAARQLADIALRGTRGPAGGRGGRSGSVQP